MKTLEKEITWSPGLIRRLRGKRTQSELGNLIGIPKNTVWRWEAGQAKPTSENSRRLSELAEKERFLKDWKVAGSAVLIGDVEEASRQVRQMFARALQRRARMLGG